MIRLSLIVAALCILVMLSGCIADDKPDPWAPLNLESMPIDGGTIYFEQSLRRKSQWLKTQAESLIRDLKAQNQNAQTLLAKSPQILVDINEIIGLTPDENQSATQSRVTKMLLPRASISLQFHRAA